ncbi:MAG: hypothetical protein PHE48_01275 [Candidatus Daviesbacteria bacterium]|nr:hypothetical protein [Candidatus Daviesbacteria bacterium]
MEKIELRSVPPKIIIQAYLSEASGGFGSYGGLDGKGPMVTIDREKGRIVVLRGSDFRGRLRRWKESGGESLCPLQQKPTLAVLNAFVNHDPRAFYDRRINQIVMIPSEVAVSVG